LEPFARPRRSLRPSVAPGRTAPACVGEARAALAPIAPAADKVEFAFPSSREPALRHRPAAGSSSSRFCFFAARTLPQPATSFRTFSGTFSGTFSDTFSDTFSGTFCRAFPLARTVHLRQGSGRWRLNLVRECVRSPGLYLNYYEYYDCRLRARPRHRRYSRRGLSRDRRPGSASTAAGSERLYIPPGSHLEASCVVTSAGVPRAFSFLLSLRARTRKRLISPSTLESPLL